MYHICCFIPFIFVTAHILIHPCENSPYKRELLTVQTETLGTSNINHDRSAKDFGNNLS